MDTTEQLYYIEHKWIPWIFYNAGKSFITTLRIKGGNLFIELLNKMNEDDPSYTCPYQANDFQVGLACDNKTNTTIFHLFMPAVTEPLFCKSIYLVHNQDFSDTFVYTSELSENGSYFLCGWTSENEHLIFSTESFGSPEDERSYVLKLFTEKAHHVQLTF